MNKCFCCGSVNFKKNKLGDIICNDCKITLERKYCVNSVHFLKRNMDIEDAKIEVSRCLYKAACIIEALEGLGIYHGNGHHAAQDIAQFAIKRFMKGVRNNG
jgi:hypothetical protein